MHLVWNHTYNECKVTHLVWNYTLELHIKCKITYRLKTKTMAFTEHVQRPTEKNNDKHKGKYKTITKIWSGFWRFLKLFRQLRTWIQDNHCIVTLQLRIKSDTGQHSQVLHCFHRCSPQCLHNLPLVLIVIRYRW